ncbi:MAG: DctP family TRAP transporter solute-binding subunit [Spirochaetes bacterium]|nr:DctP family TRAP transporter solute-binding subunit [Spirochaetota bacterium]
MKQTQRSFVLCLLILCMVFPGSLLFGKGTGESSAKMETYKLRLGHVAPTDEPYHIASVKWTELVKNYTQGKVEVSVFPNSQLGSSRDLIEALQMGVVDYTLTTAAVLANFLPKTQVIELPFIFKSREHVYAVVDSPLADKIYAGAEEKKLKVLHTWENGFRNITNSIRPIKTPDDMRGIKIRVMENQMYIDMFKALGALPVPLARGELFTALQQKVVDAQENPMGQIYSSRFYEVQKYVTLTRHTYSPEVLLCSLNTWKKIPPEFQKAIMKASEEARDYNRKLSAEKELEFIKKVQEKGMEVIDLTPEQIIPFQQKMVPVWEKYYSTIGKDLIEAVAKFK